MTTRQSIHLQFLDDLQSGFSQPQKSIPCKYFYDETGSELFERICDLDEYYLTWTEMSIMEAHVDAMVQRMGPACRLVEFGSGSSVKTRKLLDRLQAPSSYVAIDISRDHLAATSARLTADYPHLEIQALCEDYTHPLDLPPSARPMLPTNVYFPGSTIGNFTPPQAADFLAQVRRLCGPGGGLLIGVDLKKDPVVLNRAYNDAEGITAAFNLNVLMRANRELGCRFDVSCFRHHAFYSESQGRIEMHLVSLAEQRIAVGAQVFHLARNETILTEFSYKYSLEEFRKLVPGTNFTEEQVWTDERRYFSVQFLRVAP